MLTGEALPSYEALAHYIAYIATGHAFTSIGQREDYWFGETNTIRFYLIYEPTLEFLGKQRVCVRWGACRSDRQSVPGDR